MATAPVLAGKVAAITGGVTGIGRAIALAYLQHGARVAVNHLGDAESEAHFQSMKEEAAGKEAELIAVPGDIALPATGAALVAETVNRFGRLDVFVSNAGVCEFRGFLDITPDLWTQTLHTNLSGAFYSVQAAARQMVAQNSRNSRDSDDEQRRGGSIIGISSISALVGGAQQAHYTPTKAGVLSLMQSAACALGRHGIRCNALLPGTVRTGLNEADLADAGKRRYMEGRVPLGRTGVPADVAGPAVFLASELARYVTGAQLLVDGGLFVNLQ